MDRDRPVTAPLALAAYVALALAVSTGLVFNLPGLALALAAFALAAAGALLHRRRAAPLPRLVPYPALALLAVVCMTVTPATDCPLPLQIAVWAVALSGIAALALHASSERFGRVALWGFIAAKLLLLAGAVIAIPRPPIDVWQLQQYACDYLLHGKNPYTTAIPSIYAAGAAPFGEQNFYPYPPLNLLLSLPARALLGDYRYGLVASIGGALVLLRAAGRRLGVDRRDLDLLSFALLLHPRLDRLIIHGWTEPYAILAIALFVYLYARAPGSALEAITLIALPLIKQYFAVPVLLYLIMLRPRLRSLAIAGGAAALALAPLLLWNFHATVEHGLLFFVQRVAFRADSLSVAAALARWPGWRPGVWTALGAGLVAGAAAFALLRRGLPRYLLAAALALFAAILLAPQAFLNYYFSVGGLLLWGALAFSQRVD